MARKLLTSRSLRHRLEIYLNADERTQVESKAKLVGLSRSAFLRKAALGHRLEPVPVANAQQWSSLARLVGNLNQITHAINAGRAHGVDPGLIDALQVEVRALRRALIGVSE